MGEQLCKAAQKDALRVGNIRINRNDIDNVWGEYGAKRIDDLVSEHKHQCKEINELIGAFRGASRLMRRDELLKLINHRILTHLTLIFYGKRANSSVEVARFVSDRFSSSS